MGGGVPHSAEVIARTGIEEFFSRAARGRLEDLVDLDDLCCRCLFCHPLDPSPRLSVLVGGTGLEPVTSAMSRLRSNQLS